MKEHKAAGLDDICTEQIQQLGPKIKAWIINLFNNINDTRRKPKIWRKANIVALLKPGKEASSPKNYRMVTLLVIHLNCTK